MYFIITLGGTFVLKMFTMFECNSLCRMFMLCCAFDSVHIKKPATSKQGNSEVYVICCGYKGLKHVQPWIQKFFSIMDRSMLYFIILLIYSFIYSILVSYLFYCFSNN